MVGTCMLMSVDEAIMPSFIKWIQRNISYFWHACIGLCEFDLRARKLACPALILLLLSVQWVNLFLIRCSNNLDNVLISEIGLFEEDG